MLRLIALIGLIGSASTAHADIILWRFKEHRVVSPSGRWCAVITRGGQGVRYRIYDRANANDARRPELECPWREKPGAPSARPGDHLVGCGTDSTIPLETRMTDSPPRLVFVDSSGFGRGRLVTVIKPNGTAIARYSAGKMFKHRKRSFPSSVQMTHWSCGEFIDEGRLVVLVPRGIAKGETNISWEQTREPTALLAVSLHDGTLSTPDAGCLLRRIRDRRASTRTMALIAAGNLRAPGLRPIVEALAFDETEPWMIRLRASVAATQVGSTADFRPVFRSGAEATNPDTSARAFAIRRLGRVVGLDALPLLTSILEDGQVDSSAWSGRHSFRDDVSYALSDLGTAVAPVLMQWLADEKRHADLRVLATHHLGALDVREAVPLLYRAVSRGTGDLARFAISSLESMKTPGRVERFCACLEKGCAASTHIGWHFVSYPSERARGALTRALARTPDPGKPSRPFGKWRDQSLRRAAFQAALETLDEQAGARR